MAVITSDKRRWWNGYWTMYTLLRRYPSHGATALVVGCGQGDDSLLLTRMGYRVTAFDLSPDMIELAREISQKNGLTIDYQIMTAENPNLPNQHFDLILVRDILHHVEISKALKALTRMAKPGALVMINENYTHSMVQKVRNSWLVRNILYPRLVSFIYKKEKPYLTPDEAKLNEKELDECKSILNIKEIHYFNMFVTRIIPDNHVFLACLDRLLLMTLKPLGHWLSGRFILFGRTKSSA